MLENEAALKIQRFFNANQLKKQAALRQVIAESPNSQLLQAIHLRFQCMRAVAAAKFPLSKPLEDKEQIVRVISGVTKLAKETGITNLDAVAQVFQHNIMLSTMIQVPYYDLIWRKTHQGTRDIQKLVNHAYAQLQQLVLSLRLPIEGLQEKSNYSPEEVLALARDVIQYASKMIIEILANPTRQELHAVSQGEFAAVIEEILANYMTPTILGRSKEAIDLLSQKMTECPPTPIRIPEAKL